MNLSEDLGSQPKPLSCELSGKHPSNMDNMQLVANRLKQ